MNTALKEVLTFWFGSLDDDPNLEPQLFWFKSTPDIDEDMRARFMDMYHAGCAGTYDNSIKTPDDYLAIIILFDQLPRNMFRGTPQAFATDSLALAWARKAIDQGFDQEPKSAHRRVFFYMPLEHSENLDDQNLSVHLIEQLGNDGYTRFAIAHRDVIEKYGRFPHRNAILGRDSTADERAYLSQHGAGF